jgi:hypothetical protein
MHLKPTIFRHVRVERESRRRRRYFDCGRFVLMSNGLKFNLSGTTHVNDMWPPERSRNPAGIRKAQDQVTTYLDKWLEHDGG